MNRKQPGPFEKATVTAGGISLIILGILGLFLPVLPGFLFILAGLGLLSTVNAKLRRRMRNRTRNLEKKYPGPVSRLKKIKENILPGKRHTSKAKKGGLEKGPDQNR